MEASVMPLRFTLAQLAVIGSSVIGVGTGGWYTLDALDARPVIEHEWILAQSDQNDVLKGIVESQQKISDQLIQQQQQFSQSIMELQFQTLDQKQAKGVLDWHERQQYCAIAKKLDYVNIQGCN
jgi:hypothetical protein